MRNYKNRLRSETGSITSIVLVTILFFITVLGTTYMITSTQRKAQIRSQISVRNVYEKDFTEVEKLYTDITTATIQGAKIPDGFYYVGGTKQTGVVISDNIQDKDKYKGKTNVGKDLAGNQWVWVPVDDISTIYDSQNNAGQLYQYTSTTITPLKYNINQGYEPGILGDSLADLNINNLRRVMTNTQLIEIEAFEKQLKNEFEEMIKSVEKHKGFYIGRYETGDLSKTKATLKQGNSDISGQDWYTIYAKSKTIQQNNGNVRTTMIWGCQWDATINWLYSSKSKKLAELYDSNSWGNYRGLYGSVLPSGYSEDWKANNIYDLAGNANDWTLEAAGNSTRIARGGSYYTGTVSAAGRFPEPPNTSLPERFGGRAALYIK